MRKIFRKVVSILLVAVMVFGSATLAGFVDLELLELNLFSTKAEAATSGYYSYTITSGGNVRIMEVSTLINGDVIIPSTLAGFPVTNIGEYAFYNCSKITSVKIPDSVISIGNRAFSGCSNLTNVIVGNGVTRIGDNGFYYCTNLKNVTIGNSVTSIGNYAFYNCSNLAKITIPNNVIDIGDFAFYNCLNLADVYYSGAEENWKTISIGTNNESLANTKVHYNEHIVVTVDACAEVDGSSAWSKQFAISISEGDENTPLPDVKCLTIDNYGCVSFPVLITKDDLQGLSSKIFKYILTISSVDGKKYDFIPETHQVEITINNTDGILTQEGNVDRCDFKGYSYKDISFILTWDDGNDCCNVRPNSLNLNLASDRSDEKVPFIVSMDNRWRETVSVREVDDEFNHHKYSIEGLDYLEDIGYNIYLRESDDENTIYATASLPYCNVDFNTGVGSTISKQYVVEDSLVTEPEAPTSEYYNFVGWYKDENCTDGKEWDFGTDTVTQNTTLYAKWEPKPIEITLKTEHGILQDGENTKELTITIPACSAVGIKLSEEIYDSNYNHIGWVDEDGNVITATTKLYEDTILYAVWQKKPYYDSTISIKNNNGSKTINYGETLKLTVNTTNMPAGSKIYWYVDGVKKGEGDVFEVGFDGGTKIVSVKLIGEDGNVLKDVNGNEISDTETVTVKSGFFQKLISFFKNLFGMNRTVVQTIFKGVF